MFKVRGILVMNDKELIAALSVPGNYEVIVLENGEFIVMPLPSDVILITKESHADSVSHFSIKKD
ncbi:TPA: hypothetical protein HMT71_14025 [Escherichia coli]|nr:hypothetical protein [Escherichia coli]EFN7700157.1 hypothetical protein [Escherichia coli]EFN9815997.1 hypothetical protein [Escherichia coli]OII52966.1 hypothetical protein BFX01_18700 [Escherichia coli]HAJ3084760.1 hypothetical protein [Escherichia coli]